MTNRITRSTIVKIPVIGPVARYTYHGLRPIFGGVAMSRELASLKSQIKRLEEQQRGNLFAENHLLDSFYAGFEDRFRGAEKTILANMKKDYAADYKKSKIDFEKHPVLDIGCGRGEFLRMLKSINVNAMGVDINLEMVRRAQERDLQVVQGRAVEFLNQPGNENHYGSITGFHIVEHIPFQELLELFAACHRSLIDGGFVIFETPNPENVTVGSSSFYLDPSHLNPIPPILLAFALEFSGFKNVEIRRYRALNDTVSKNIPKEIDRAFFGPRDYSVVAFKLPSEPQQ